MSPIAIGVIVVVVAILAAMAIKIVAEYERGVIFRLGRVNLFYQSPDGKTCGYFDVAEAGWRPLAPAHNRAIQTAINIGAKRHPAELLNLPIGKMAIR